MVTEKSQRGGRRTLRYDDGFNGPRHNRWLSRPRGGKSDASRELVQIGKHTQRRSLVVFWAKNESALELSRRSAMNDCVIMVPIGPGGLSTALAIWTRATRNKFAPGRLTQPRQLLRLQNQNRYRLRIIVGHLGSLLHRWVRDDPGLRVITLLCSRVGSVFHAFPRELRWLVVQYSAPTRPSRGCKEQSMRFRQNA